MSAAQTFAAMVRTAKAEAQRLGTTPPSQLPLADAIAALHLEIIKLESYGRQHDVFDADAMKPLYTRIAAWRRISDKDVAHRVIEHFAASQGKPLPPRERIRYGRAAKA